ncbi:MAG: hypothetical protein QF578_15650 [Alphaproteobacteria bacterium]|nr:hypothetical protein [Alphaproteobacteria bacterium]MDP6566262.1 hypothetical protein [Alphaproteobacteria bacterium]MDP6814654.1 hypothetical protein [Alphaproteobacteria bacterium]
MSGLAPIVWLIGLLAAAEIGLALLHRALKPGFQWLIGPEDETPAFPSDLIDKYQQTSLDPDLGWARRPGTSGEDQLPAGSVRFHIDDEGCRRNPGFDGRPSRIAAFGDSFTFCRLVDDEGTWPHQLSRRLDTNVRNFGVGNYGFDQALLRLETELPDLAAEAVIIGIVPETIARVQSYWKHYFEYGNILAFKPRFTLDGGGLRLHPPAVRRPEDFATIHSRLEDVCALDPFHARKFRPDMLRFPYLWHLPQRWRRHGPILGHLSWGLLTGRAVQGRRRAFEVVMAENARWTAALYDDAEACDLLAALIERFADVCRAAGRQPLLLVIPQPVDFADIDAGRARFPGFFKAMRQNLTVLDMTERFQAVDDRDALYVDGALGPHVSARGNEIIVEALAPLVQDMLAPPS